MFEQQVIPAYNLRAFFLRSIATCKFAPLESGNPPWLKRLAQFLEGKPGLVIGYCAHAGMVDLRLSSLDSELLNEEALNELGDQCRELIGEDFVCYGDRSLAEVIFRELRSLNQTLAVAESCTGGLLSSSFTEVPGVSKVFHGGAVCYHNDAKVQILEVPEIMLEQHGAVSEEIAIAMATSASEKFGTDYGLSITGFAGPTGGTQILPIGSIYLGYSSHLESGQRSLTYGATVHPTGVGPLQPPSTGCAVS